MTAKTFNTAVNAPHPYVFDLDREVAAFYHDHPEQKKKLFFIDASTLPGKLYRGGETDKDAVKKRLDKNEFLSDDIIKTNKTGKFGSVRYDAENYSCVILKTPRNRTDVNLLGYSAPSDVVDLFSFDHEIGHLLCPKGREGMPRMQECIADAYAVIRHLQRFGADAASIKNLTAMRTVEMIFGKDNGHFTAPVVEKIIADSRTTDFSKLTPADTVAWAQRYAEKNAPDEQLVNYMGDNFGKLGFDPVKMQQGDFRALRDLGEWVLKTNLPEEFSYGAAALKALLDGEVSIHGHRLPNPAGPEWTKLRQDIDARAATVEQPKRSGLFVVSDMGGMKPF